MVGGWVLFSNLFYKVLVEVYSGLLGFYSQVKQSTNILHCCRIPWIAVFGPILGVCYWCSAELLDSKDDLVGMPHLLLGMCLEFRDSVCTSLALGHIVGSPVLVPCKQFIRESCLQLSHNRPILLFLRRCSFLCLGLYRLLSSLRSLFSLLYKKLTITHLASPVKS